LTIGNIERATSYQWYKNGTSISDATTQTYTVVASGTYTVAGVNAAGTGTPSPAHVVTIENCAGSFVDELVGTWYVAEVYATVNPPATYSNDHEIIIEKVSATSIKIIGFNNYLAEDEEITIANVDNAARIITIPPQKTTVYDGYDVHHVAINSDDFCTNKNNSIVSNPVAAGSYLSVTFSYEFTYEAIGLGIIYGSIAYQSGNCLGGWGLGCGTEWTKTGKSTSRSNLYLPKWLQHNTIGIISNINMLQ
jgi:hypothetical protein